MLWALPTWCSTNLIKGNIPSSLRVMHSVGPKTIFFWAPTMKVPQTITMDLETWQFRHTAMIALKSDLAPSLLRILYAAPKEDRASAIDCLWQHAWNLNCSVQWGITFANISDFKRPPELLSYPQQIAVTATGLIWTRYSTVISPVSPLLCSLVLYFFPSYSFWTINSLSQLFTNPYNCDHWHCMYVMTHQLNGRVHLDLQ